ncbi:MAG TPA: hypothetical protein VH600_13645 [Burkholderiales bacterium]
MDPITFEAYTRNPELKQALIRQARRERAEAIYCFVLEPIKSLFTKVRRNAACAHFAAAR